MRKTEIQSSFHATDFLNAANAPFIAELYMRYLHNPSSVDVSWNGFFQNLNDDEKSMLTEVEGLPWAKRKKRVIGVADATAKPKSTVATADAQQAALDSIRTMMLIRAFRVKGHLAANLDPLKLKIRGEHPALDPSHYGFTQNDMDREIYLDNVLGLEKATLRQIMDILTRTYTGTVGVEYLHILDREQKSWIQERVENKYGNWGFDATKKTKILNELTRAESFEKFLHTKFVGAKRFGADGAESMIPAIEEMIETAVELGVNDITIGMAHRGRLNVLANIIGKTYRSILSEFKGMSAYPDSDEVMGDVKYHLGTTKTRTINGKDVTISLANNPSHLEAVNPVVMGRVRAKQSMAGDVERKKIMGILIHGDAAVAGQGIVPETLACADLVGYTTGGTVHFIVNNQIGFTTNPEYARSFPHPSEVAKVIQAPIFHVNGDDVEAVVHVSRLAMEYRQRFAKDVVVNMVCYRRHGHNEGDEPAFTQPKMYEAIKRHTSARTLYADKLMGENTVTSDQSQKMLEDFHTLLENEFAAADDYEPNLKNWLEEEWKNLSFNKKSNWTPETGVKIETLKKLGDDLTRVPENFHANSKIVRQLKSKQDMFKKGEDFDWATAEAMAFGSLLLESHPIRLSGQDCGRGTFSHRHSVLRDEQTEEKYVPLNNLADQKANYEVIDSLLSELAVLGFEYGHAATNPNALTIWEAQFGDFSNGAQIIIDQFLVSGETKWVRMSGLVMLLPHGHEGQGPEHTSARPERYLQMCALHNMSVANCTTPANYFHILRRQIKRDFRKPLILMTPKSLLRHKLCVSPLKDFGPKTSFQPVIDEIDTINAPDKIKRIVLCTGKIYYDLLQARREKNIKDVALVRVEEIYPLAENKLKEIFTKYKNAEIIWCQEEPENMGYWQHLDRKLENIAGKRPQIISRVPAPSPAVGTLSRHEKEQAEIINNALSVK